MRTVVLLIFLLTPLLVLDYSSNSNTDSGPTRLRWPSKHQISTSMDASRALFYVALALHAATTAARTMPSATQTGVSTSTPTGAGMTTASLPVLAAASAASGTKKNDLTAGSGTAVAGVTKRNNLFVGVGGMGHLPGFPAVGCGYDACFDNNDGIVFSGITGPLLGVGVRVGGVGLMHGVGGFRPLGGGGVPFGATARRRLRRAA